MLDAAQEQRITAFTRWLFDTCILFGTTAETAAAVAGHFAAGLRQDR